MPPLAATTLRRWTASRFARNAVALYASFVIGTVVSLVIVAYLSRVIGPGPWGLVLMAQALAGWLGQLPAYGFGLGATRAIAQARGDKEEISRIATAVFVSQGIFALVSIPAGILAAAVLPPLHQHPSFVAAAWCLGIATGIGPRWYFQGMERMLPISWTAMLTAGITVCGTIFLVHKPAQAVLAVWVQAIGMAIGSACLGFLLYKEVPLVVPRSAHIRYGLRLGWSMFIYRMSTLLYTNANTLVLGLLVPAALVSFYGSAEKINKAVLALSGPVTTVLFPSMARLAQADPVQARHIVRQAFWAYAAAGCALGAGVAVGAPLIVGTLLGPHYVAAIPLVRMLAGLIPLVAVSGVLGLQWMVPLGLDSLFSRLILAAGVLNVGLSLLLVPRFGDAGMAVAVLSAELFLTLAMGWSLERRDIGIVGGYRRSTKSV